MGFASDANSIRPLFGTAFAIAQPTVTVLDQNQPAALLDPTKTYARLSVLPAGSALVGLGASRRWRNLGIIEVQILTPLGQGDGDLREIADDVADILRGITQDQVRTRAPSLTILGQTEEFYQGNVTVPFYADYLD